MSTIVDRMTEMIFRSLEPDSEEWEEADHAADMMLFSIDELHGQYAESDENADDADNGFAHLKKELVSLGLERVLPHLRFLATRPIDDDSHARRGAIITEVWRAMGLVNLEPVDVP